MSIAKNETILVAANCALATCLPGNADADWNGCNFMTLQYGMHCSAPAYVV